MRLFDHVISLVGAVLILTAYLALQRGWMLREDRQFNALNLVGSILLTYSAVQNWNPGFIILEGSWALLSISGTFARPKQS